MTRRDQFFDHNAREFDSFYDGSRSAWMQWLDQRFRSDMFIRFGMTFERLGDISGQSILDIGCGSGRYVVEALGRGAAQVTGIDPAARMLELARDSVARAGASDRATFVQGSFPAACPALVFDAAIVMGVMDYVAEPLAFLRALRNTVRRGAAISFPSIHWFRTPIRRCRYRLRHCPVHFYTRERIEDLMPRAAVATFDISKIPGAGMDFFVWLQP